MLNYYPIFIKVYHFSILLVALALWVITVRLRRLEGMLNRLSLFLSLFVFLESLGFLWLLNAAEHSFGIKGQGLQVALEHLVFIGPVFLLSVVLNFFVTQEKRLCVWLTLGYVLLGAVAVAMDGLK